MKTTLFSAVIALAAATAVVAQDAVQDAPADVVMECCCCNTSSWYFGAEATFFKVHEANGVQSADLQDTSFDYEINPRLTLGWVRCDGLGARVEYWRYDETQVAPGPDPIVVDTYTIDLEVFQVLEVCPCTTLEVFGGVRYNDFFFFRDDNFIADDMHSYRGWGGTVGINANRTVGQHLSLYGGLTQRIMAGDANFFSITGNEQDTIRPISEIALGVRYDSCNWWFNAGYEWHNWSNYVESAGVANADHETSDLGFVGFVVGGGMSF